MNYSGYQIESLVKRFRRLHGLWRTWGGAPRPRGDPLNLSEEARTLAQASRAQAARAGARGPAFADLADRTRYPALVELELERRAGSFMPDDDSADDEFGESGADGWDD